MPLSNRTWPGFAEFGPPCVTLGTDCQLPLTHVNENPHIGELDLGKIRLDDVDVK